MKIVKVLMVAAMALTIGTAFSGCTCKKYTDLEAKVNAASQKADAALAAAEAAKASAANASAKADEAAASAARAEAAAKDAANSAKKAEAVFMKNMGK